MDRMDGGGGATSQRPLTAGSLLFSLLDVIRGAGTASMNDIPIKKWQKMEAFTSRLVAI